MVEAVKYMYVVDRKTEVQGQRSVSSEDRVETSGRTDGGGVCIYLPR